MLTLDQWKNNGSNFEYNGHRIFYVDEGTGDALVCVHGFPTASWDWALLWPRLAQRFRVIAPDMIGFGFSAKPRNYAYSILDQATLHESLLQSLGVTSAHILAHDYGDTVAQELLARYKDRRIAGEAGLHIKSVCLLNGGIFPSEHRPRLIQRLLASPVGALVSALMSERKFHRSFSEIFGPNTRPTADQLAEFWRLISHNNGARVMHKLIHYMGERVTYSDRWVGALTECPGPLCFINGPEDPISGRHMAETYRRLVPDPRVVLLEGIGHYPQVEAPQQVLDAYFGFLDAIG